MKFFIGFDTIEEALALLNKAHPDEDEATAMTVATPGTVDPRFGVELDAKGFPWCAEVHAGTKGKNQDGTWKQKKGVTAEARAAAEQKALAHLQATMAPATATLEPAVQTPVTMPNPGVVAPGLGAGMPGLPAAVTQPPVSYEQLTELYANLAGAGLLDAAKMQGVYIQCGVNPADLGTNETARRSVYTALRQIEAAAQAPAGMPGM